MAAADVLPPSTATATSSPVVSDTDGALYWKQRALMAEKRVEQLEDEVRWLSCRLSTLSSSNPSSRPPLTYDNLHSPQVGVRPLTSSGPSRLSMPLSRSGNLPGLPPVPTSAFGTGKESVGLETSSPSSGARGFMDSVGQALRIAIIGGEGSGCTTLLGRFSSNAFHPSSPSNGDEFGPILHMDNDLVQLIVPGRENAATYPPPRALDAVSAVVLVYDITERASLKDLQAIMDTEQMKRAPLPAIVVGTKCDEADERDVEEPKASKWARKYGYAHFEVSALTGERTAYALAHVVQLARARALPASPRLPSVSSLPSLSMSQLSLDTAGADIDPSLAIEDVEEKDEPDLRVKGGDVIAASLTALVSIVTGERVFANVDANTLLLSYRTSNSSSELLAAIIRRFASAPSAVVRLRCMNLLKHWLEHFSSDFANNTKLASHTSLFLQGDTVQRSDVRDAASVCLRKLAQTNSRSACSSQHEEEREDLSPICLLDCNPLEVARQLTMIDWEYWASLQACEMVQTAWLSPEKDKYAPNVVAITRRFNELSNWAATNVVTTDIVKERVRMVKKILLTAEHLRALGNYHSMLALLAGLERGAVQRMRHTLDAVTSSRKYALLWADLRSLTAARGNFANLRETTSQTQAPVIPYLGMYLGELASLEESFKTKDDAERLLWEKCVRRAQVINALMAPLHTKHCFAVQPRLRARLLSLHSLEDEELYDKSEALEPRGLRRGTTGLLLSLSPRGSHEQMPNLDSQSNSSDRQSKSKEERRKRSLKEKEESKNRFESSRLQRRRRSASMSESSEGSVGSNFMLAKRKTRKGSEISLRKLASKF